jgi:hypothetical protein
MESNTTNPYKSPLAASAEGQSKGSRPHSTSVRKEAWRGAKFGALLMATAMGCVAGVVILVLLGVAIFRWTSTGVSPLVQAGGVGIILNGLMLFIAKTIAFSFFGAIIGALVMGIVAFFRKFLPRRKDSDPT